MLTGAGPSTGAGQQSPRIQAPAVPGPGAGRTRVGPFHVLLAATAGALVYLAVGPISDVDAAWHVEIGRHILSGNGVSGHDTDWLGVPTGPWQTSQWLSEVAMALAVQHGGWVALPVGRLVLLAAILGTLALTSGVGRRPLPAAAVGLPVVLVLCTSVQERPATASYVFLPLVGWACHRLWSGGRPPLAVIAGCCFVWAQLHGLWVLAPAAFSLVALGTVLDGPRRHAERLRAALLALAASMVGLVNPLGLSSLLLPLRVRDAAAEILEWEPTALSSPWVWCASLVGLLLLVALVRSPVPVSRTETLWCLSWLLFACLAYRNVVPAMLMLAPVAIAAVDRAWAWRLPARPPGRREAAALRATVGAVLAGSLALAVWAQAETDPLGRLPAVGVARVLAQQPGEVRVWNDYNTSGSLIAFGGGRLRLRIDGRADMWGGAEIRRQIGVQFLAEGWEADLRRFDPDALVLPGDAPLTTLLTREGTWRITARDRKIVLLQPTGSARS